MLHYIKISQTFSHDWKYILAGRFLAKIQTFSTLSGHNFGCQCGAPVIAGVLH